MGGSGAGCPEISHVKPHQAKHHLNVLGKIVLWM